MQYIRVLKENEKPEIVVQEMVTFVDKIAKVKRKKPTEPALKPGLNV